MRVTQTLADFAVAPVAGAAAQAMMRLSLLDWTACGIAGADEPVARIVREMALSDAGTAEATVLGSEMRLPARAAALVNGTASHALDYDDTHFGHIGHPSVAVIPAALALAERTDADGLAFLEAALVGAEVSIRVGLWLGRAHYQTGFHQTATAGAFGATLAAGRLIGLKPAQMAHALGIAATRAAGLKSQFGTMGKPYHAGMAAATGVEAARLAAAGFVSRPDGVEAAQGFGATHAGEGAEDAFDGLGKRWHFETVQHKFHACCHGTHAALEALAGRKTPAAQVEAVEIVTHPRWLTVCNIAAPETGLEAKFSYRLTAALALAGRDTAALQSFTAEACRDAELVALRDKVSVISDQTLFETEARVYLKGHGGVETLTHDLTAPITLEARRSKLEEKAAALLGAGRAERVSAAVAALDLAGLTREMTRAPE